MATPSKPLGRMSRTINNIASLYVMSPSPVDFKRIMSPIAAAAIMPGTMMTNGMNIFGNVAMIGERRAADIELEAIARWTSTKLVVQYPKDSTNPRPNTIPITDHTGLSNPDSA